MSQYWHLISKDRTKTRCGIALSEKVQESLRACSHVELQMVPVDGVTCPDCQKAGEQ